MILANSLQHVSRNEHIAHGSTGRFFLQVHCDYARMCSLLLAQDLGFDLTVKNYHLEFETDLTMLLLSWFKTLASENDSN